MTLPPDMPDPHYAWDEIPDPLGQRLGIGAALFFIAFCAGCWVADRFPRRKP